MKGLSDIAEKDYRARSDKKDAVDNNKWAGQILYKAHTDRKCMSDVFSAIGLSEFPWIKAH